jgi:hypothetical protein
MNLDGKLPRPCYLNLPKQRRKQKNNGRTMVSDLSHSIPHTHTRTSPRTIKNQPQKPLLLISILFFFASATGVFPLNKPGKRPTKGGKRRSQNPFLLIVVSLAARRGDSLYFFPFFVIFSGDHRTSCRFWTPRGRRDCLCSIGLMLGSKKYIPE